MKVKVGDLVSCQPELLRELGESQFQRDLGMVINLIPDHAGGEPWALVRWRDGEVSIPITSDIVVISES